MPVELDKRSGMIHKRISEIKKGGGPVVVSSIPQRAERFAKIAEEAGADFFVVQSTVTTARHSPPSTRRSTSKQLKKHCRFRSSSATSSPTRPASS